MCTRFVYNGSDTIVGFNFDIDPADYEHRVIAEHDRFFIGIRMPDGKFHPFMGCMQTAMWARSCMYTETTAQPRIRAKTAVRFRN